MAEGFDTDSTLGKHMAFGAGLRSVWLRPRFSQLFWSAKKNTQDHFVPEVIFSMRLCETRAIFFLFLLRCFLQGSGSLWNFEAIRHVWVLTFEIQWELPGNTWVGFMIESWHHFTILFRGGCIWASAFLRFAGPYGFSRLGKGIPILFQFWYFHTDLWFLLNLLSRY